MQDALGKTSVPSEVMKDTMPRVLKVLTAFEKVGKTLGLDEGAGTKGDDPRDETKMTMGRITGKVTYDGKIVPAGIINFHPEMGRGVVAVIDNGKYIAEKVPPGRVTFTVNTAEIRRVYKALEAQRKSGGGLGGAPPLRGGAGPHVKDKLKGTKGPADLPGAKELAKKEKEAREKIKDLIDVPQKFADPKTSGLTYTVKAGSQEINVKIPKVDIKEKDDPKKEQDKKSDK